MIKKRSQEKPRKQLWLRNSLTTPNLLEKVFKTKLIRKLTTKSRKELISNPISLLGPSNTNQGFPNNPNPEREARRVLDSYGGRSHYMENDEEATR